MLKKPTRLFPHDHVGGISESYEPLPRSLDLVEPFLRNGMRRCIIVFSDEDEYGTLKGRCVIEIDAHQHRKQVSDRVTGSSINGSKPLRCVVR